MKTWLKESWGILVVIAILTVGTLVIATTPPVVLAAPQAAKPDVECVEWGDTGYWTITRCKDWNSDEVCFMASSGFLLCKFD